MRDHAPRCRRPATTPEPRPGPRDRPRKRAELEHNKAGVRRSRPASPPSLPRRWRHSLRNRSAAAQPGSHRGQRRVLSTSSVLLRGSVFARRICPSFRRFLGADWAEFWPSFLARYIAVRSPTLGQVRSRPRGGDSAPKFDVGSLRGAGFTPPASRPCAGQRNKSFRTGTVSPAPPNVRRPSCGRCSNSDRRSASELRRVPRRRVRSSL